MEEGKKERSRSQRFLRATWKGLSRLFLILLFLIISLSFVFHIPAVQQWSIKKISSFLSQRMETEVSVGRIDFNVLHNFTLDGLYIKDPTGHTDTLLYSERINLRFRNLFSLLNNRLTIRQLTVNKANVHMSRLPGQERSNLEAIIAKLSNPEAKKEPGKLFLRFRSIHLENISLVYEDEVTGKKLMAELPHGDFSVRQLDFAKKELEIRYARLERPQFSLKSLPSGAIVPIEPEIVDSLTSAEQIASKLWHISILDLRLHEGNIQMDSRDSLSLETDYAGVIDFKNLHLADVKLALQGIELDNGELNACINQFSLKEVNSGLGIANLLVGNLTMNTNTIILDNMVLTTGESLLQDSLSLSFDSFASFRDFTNEVRLGLKLEDSWVAIKDLVKFTPGLARNQFFQNNPDDIIRIEGVFSGRIDRIRVEDLKLQSEDFTMSGEFRARDITKKGAELINLDIEEATFRMQTLEEIIPNLNLPPNFNKLGEVRFSGNYDGLFKDFVAYGRFATSLGRANVDMRLNLKDGRENAAYSGNVQLIGFNLGKWTGNPDLGMIDASLQVKEGKGLTDKTAQADLSGRIDRFEFLKYPYSNIQMSGRLERNLFDGEAVINEENINLTFQGEVDFSDTIPSFNFRADVDSLNLFALNITKKPFSVSGKFDVNARGKTVSSLNGSGFISDLLLKREGGRSHRLDSMRFNSSTDTLGGQRLSVESEVLDGYIEGEFRLADIPAGFIYELKDNYPALMRNINLETEPPETAQDFNFDLVLHNPENWLDFAGIPEVRVRELTMKGNLSSSEDRIDVDFEADAFSFKQFHFYGISGQLYNKDQKGLLEVYVVAADLNESLIFEEIDLKSEVQDSAVQFDLSILQVADFFDTLSLPGSFTLRDGVFDLQLSSARIKLLDNAWKLDPGNRLVIDGDSIFLDGMEFVSGNKFMVLDDINGKGLQLEVGGFNASIINELWEYEKLMFEGPYTMFFQVKDLRNLSGVDLRLDIPALSINEDAYGSLQLKAISSGSEKPLQIDCLLQMDTMRLHTTGSYFPPLQSVDSLKRNVMDLNIDHQNFPLKFFEYILKDGIENTVGALTGNIRLAGPMNDIDLSGKSLVTNGATTITYLGTRYFFDDQEVLLSNERVDVTGAVIKDSRGQGGTITGGLTHNRLKNFGLDARIIADDIELLNTTRADNALFYGNVFGSVDVRFTGSMIRPNILVRGETKVNTYLAIPLDSRTSGLQGDFIEFVTPDTTTSALINNGNVQISGVNIEIDVTVTEDATIEIIFDQYSGEIIRSTGNGNIRLLVSREGEMSMYGNYTIVDGTYLFTYNIMQRPFIIRSGSLIQWGGDPYDAQIQIYADYPGLRATLSTFLAEYLVNVSQSTLNEARSATEIDLTLILTGSLLAPEINFEIAFPELTGELSGYANSKLRALQANPNALNEQVFGLLAFGTFLPSNLLQGGGSNQSQLLQSALTNSVSDMLTGFLSSFFSDLLGGAVKGVGFISGTDFNFQYNENIDIGDQNLSYREVEVRLRNRLFNDRVIVDVGGNYVTDSPISEGQYFAGDFAVEYVLTRDRRLKIRFSHRNDQTIEGQKKFKYGIGLSYRREFDSFGELLRGIRRDVNEAEEEEEFN